jgi:hypothetical protein
MADQHTSEDCLKFAMDELAANPSIVQFQVNILLDSDRDLFYKELWPAAKDPTTYYRLSTRRPSAKELNPDADYYHGTDVVVRTFSNDKWEENNRTLHVIVKEEMGELSTEWKVLW